MVPYRRLFEDLVRSNIKFLIAGGFAVNFHQVQRATVDLDLILHLEKENVLSFLSLMSKLGFRPRVPVKPEEFADNAIRKKWILEKGMRVFSFIHSNNPLEVVDVFSEEPLPFDTLWNSRLEVRAFGLKLPVIGKAHLIELKQQANREKDRYDIEQLKKITD